MRDVEHFGEVLAGEFAREFKDEDDLTASVRNSERRYCRNYGVAKRTTLLPPAA